MESSVVKFLRPNNNKLILFFVVLVLFPYPWHPHFNGEFPEPSPPMSFAWPFQVLLSITVYSVVEIRWGFEVAFEQSWVEQFVENSLFRSIFPITSYLMACYFATLYKMWEKRKSKTITK